MIAAILRAQLLSMRVGGRGRVFGMITGLIWYGFWAVIGFVLSVPFDLPTGPAIICISGVLALLAWGVRRLRG